MMRHETRTIHTCDICQQECSPVQERLVTLGYSLESPVNVRFRVSAINPMVTDGDVCEVCFRRAVESLVRGLFHAPG